MSSGMKGFGGEVKGLSPRSTSGYMLYWLRQQHEFPNLVLKWRHVRKRRSLYYDGIYGHMYMDGRVRPQYDLVSTKTGRKATNRPDIHNLPRGDEIYNIFVPDPGWCLIHADYQTAEMRMMAHYSGDKILLHALDTSDIHTLMAIEMFHLAPEQLKSMTKGELSDKRIAAKMICLTPDHLVVTAGLEWKPVGTLKIGEDLLAFTETGFQGRGSKRRWEVAKVTNNLREVGEVFEVLMSNGDKIKTTAAHRWLTRKTMKCGSLGPLIWIRTDELKAGKTWLPRVLDVWKAEKGTKAGYVRGILDSEGYISNHARLLGYSQNDNQVLEDTQAALEYFNVKTHLHANRNAYDILVQGNTFDKWKILGRFRPRRLLEKFKTSLPAFIMPDEGSGRWDRVEKITSLGTKEVVVLATSTGTLVAEGRPMHNTFGLPYGRSAAGLAPQLGVSKEEAEEYMNVYKRQFPGLFKWIDEQRARGVSEQGITSVFGRRRRFPLITGRFHKKEVERMAGNFAIQSAINDLTLLAYVNTYKALKAASIPVWPGAHIHDSINFTVPIPFWKAAVGEVVKAMAYKPFESEVNFPAEVEIGVRWGSMITVHKSGNWVGLDPEDESIPEWLKRTIPQGMPE